LLLARAVGAEQSSRIGNQTGGRVFLFLHTDDFWRDYKAYQRKGVVFVREPVEESYGTVAVFKDLYGNLWDLVMDKKPLGRKNYGHIPHLPGSRLGPGDHQCNEGQARIATEKTRDKNDEVFVQEKLDGSNVGVARIGDTIHPLGRAGYLAASSPYQQHRHFGHWAYTNLERFMAVLREGERLVGEWLMQAHGTRYNLQHEPFVAFDLMVEDERRPYYEFARRVAIGEFVTPALLHCGGALSIDEAMNRLDVYGFHSAIDPVEGAVWRVERDKPTGKKGEKKRVVDFLVKFVRPDKIDGSYLPEISGKEPVWNWYPENMT
jgi:hypothetical protein